MINDMDGDEEYRGYIIEKHLVPHLSGWHYAEPLDTQSMATCTQPGLPPLRASSIDRLKKIIDCVLDRADGPNLTIHEWNVYFQDKVAIPKSQIVDVMNAAVAIGESVDGIEVDLAPVRQQVREDYLVATDNSMRRSLGRAYRLLAAIVEVRDAYLALKNDEKDVDLAR